MKPIRFRKGHGTGNDFVILPDTEPDPTPTQVAALCHRRFGIGADGILRVVPTADADVASELVAGAEWFMDYRNADGSVAEMCGNGARVFARYLVDAGLQDPGEFLIGTRGGPRMVEVPSSGPVTVAMGPVEVRAPRGERVTLGDRSLPATAAFAPNPHAVAFLDGSADGAEWVGLDDLGDISAADTEPTDTFPDGVNVEFITVTRADALAMRVRERGSGETLSCGTGACAAAAVYRVLHPQAPDRVEVCVPGGDLVISFADGQALLTGPAVVLANGVVDREWWLSQ